MSILVLLVVVPLSLRYLASWKMRQMRAVLLQQEKEARALMARYEELTEDLKWVEQGRRQCDVRRSFLAADIAESRRVIDQLRSASPADKRLAA